MVPKIGYRDCDLTLMLPFHAGSIVHGVDPDQPAL